MKTRIVQALALAVLLAIALTTVAAAETGSGTGTLTARGDGLAALRGNISVTLRGAGLLIIRDQAGDASIHVNGRGYKKQLSDGTVAYIGFDGKAEIKGSAITVVLRGRNIKLEAAGTGSFLLRGRGTYHTEKGDGQWSEKGEPVTLSGPN